jgi:acyl carrier protein
MSITKRRDKVNIESVVKDFIRNELMFGNDGAKLDSNTDLIGSGMLDSVAVLRLILFIEERFGVHVADGEVLPDNFRTVDMIRSFVENKQAATA